MAASWRPMTEDDLDTVLTIAAAVHPGYPESRAVFSERLRLYPIGCRMAEGKDEVSGYAVMHPGRLGISPALDSLLEALPDSADCLYLHDVALLPSTRGRGVGTAALAHAHALAVAAGWGWLALTSTPEARPYWERQGFTPYAVQPAALASYGGGMAYMVRPA